MTIDSASWDGRVLTVRGSGENRDTVTLVNANDPNQVLGTRDIGRRGSWRIRDWRPNPVPCAVAASAQGQEPVIREVQNAPGNCAEQALQAVGCSIAVDPTSRNFGDVNVGSSATRVATVTNTGTSACALNVSTTGTTEFALTTPASISVAAGDTATVGAHYTPVDVGPDSGSWRSAAAASLRSMYL